MGDFPAPASGLALRLEDSPFTILSVNQTPSSKQTAGTMNHLRLPLAALLALVLIACQSPPSTDSIPDEASVETDMAFSPITVGEELYLEYCQSCHGAEGRGNGPLADLLRIPPPDLTLIQERAMGVFDVDRIASYIDGRGGLEGHGTRKMPVWGNIWTDAEGGADAEQDVRDQINELVEYIRSMQEDIPDL